MKIILLLVCFLCGTVLLYAQPKIVGNLTATFSISSSTGGKKEDMSNAQKILYLRGKMLRVDIISNAYTQVSIYNFKDSSAVVLREFGAEKFITRLNTQKWKDNNIRFKDMQVMVTDETKMILGYNCKKAVATLADGTTNNIYFTTDFMITVSENPYQFKNVPGFVLEYESRDSQNKSVITYTATQIDLNPVPAGKFDIPKSGYKIYNE